MAETIKLRIVEKTADEAGNELAEMHAIVCGCGCIVTCTGDRKHYDRMRHGIDPCPECGRVHDFLWVLGVGELPRRVLELGEIRQLLLAIAHAPGCKLPEMCPRSHADCAPRLNHATAFAWAFAKHMGENQRDVAMLALRFARENHGSINSVY